ncbi:LysR family transcriptional regulator [Solimicrobium silvestre]|uniref:Transcriptional regulator n=1 Tax=Solimicrobium silvestre TaxID=2099400 RepID=A0A2S9GVY0_9BURK|nr:LysR family transcriptional regulator [Solimicrobium silvestre]PRC91816.1 Transcriptional regulator [Solimicrobium silvestre]
MDKLRSMEVFVGVVDAGSFSAVARAFDMSTVMVGKYIADLEQRLGARLLNRTTRRQSLTEIGELYCEQCRQILAQVSIAESGAEAMRATARGTLKVSAPVAFGSECLAPAMATYLEQYPDVSMDLELSNRLSDVVEEGLDAAVRIGQLDDSAMIARPLRPYKMVICASAAYLERFGTPKTPDDLAQHQCLDFLHWRRHVRWRLNQPDAAATLPASRFRSNNGQALKQAALAGVGIMMQAEIVLADDIQRGRLIPILEEFIPIPRPMHLIYPRDRQPTPKLTTFIEFVVERFGVER